MREKGPLVKFRFTNFDALPVVGASRHLAIQVSGALRPLASPGDSNGWSGGKGLQVDGLGSGKFPPCGRNPRPHTCKPSEGRQGRRGGVRIKRLGLDVCQGPAPRFVGIVQSFFSFQAGEEQGDDGAE